MPFPSQFEENQWKMAQLFHTRVECVVRSRIRRKKSVSFSFELSLLLCHGMPEEEEQWKLQQLQSFFRCYRSCNRTRNIFRIFGSYKLKCPTTAEEMTDSRVIHYLSPLSSPTKSSKVVVVLLLLGVFFSPSLLLLSTSVREEQLAFASSSLSVEFELRWNGMNIFNSHEHTISIPLLTSSSSSSRGVIQTRVTNLLNTWKSGNLLSEMYFQSEYVPDIQIGATEEATRRRRWRWRWIVVAITGLWISIVCRMATSWTRIGSHLGLN